MAKGTFGTPRAVGSVNEIRISKLALRLTEDGSYDFSVDLEEGDTTGPDFEIVESGNVRLNESVLSAADQLALDNILKVMIRAYIAQEGYTGVVIS